MASMESSKVHLIMASMENSKVSVAANFETSGEREIDLNRSPVTENIFTFFVNNEEEYIADRIWFDLNEPPNIDEDIADFVDNTVERDTILIDLNEPPNMEIVIDLNEPPNIDDNLTDSVNNNSETDENNDDESLNEEHSQLTRHRFLNNDERRRLFESLLQRSVNGKLSRGVTKEVALEYLVPIRTVQCIWKQGGYGNVYADVSHARTKNCGRKRINLDLDRFRGIPLSQRTNFRSLSCSMNMKKTTLFRRLQSGDIRRHSNAIKPFLKEENKRSRLQFCMSMLDGDSIPRDPIFVGMYNIVHIDEKWFYMTKKVENYYLLPDEEDPIRTCKSKNFIGKVMFLVALARPRFDEQGNELFSGKIGVFPFVTQEPAKRSSVNRIAGTLETKPITSVNKEVIRSYLIEKVIPAIKEKWPREDSRHPIFIQQDNARTHIDPNDAEFCHASKQDGFDIRLMSQPPNSPDLNVLDLGFFSAIQSLQHKESPKTVDELVNAVMKSYEAFPTVKSNHIFLTLQLCMVEIMRARGSHKYKIPHVKKETLEREGRLPTQIKCDVELVQEVIDYLS